MLDRSLANTTVCLPKLDGMIITTCGEDDILGGWFHGPSFDRPLHQEEGSLYRCFVVMGLLESM